MLKKIRICLATVFFVGITLLLIGIGAGWWGWMAKLQFLPAALALNFGVVLGILLLTFLVGRMYCSVICPMGVFQDIIIWLRTYIGPKKTRAKRAHRFHYQKELKWVRYPILGVVVLCLILGVQFVVALLAPYSAYGRIIHSIVDPQRGILVVAILTLVAIVSLAWWGGRWYCNTICPVGTVLSFASRFSVLQPRIDADKCKSCRQCEKGCKAQCIDIDAKKIDHSRCVNCFSCVDACKFGALQYRAAGPAPLQDAAESGSGADKGRRAFVIGAAIAAGTATLKAQEMKLDGGLAPIIPKQVPERAERLVPFGAQGLKHFYSHCTACQLCVSNCPNHVLRPSTDLAHLMQPEMSYERGYCRPECTVCSQVCPAGAILAITPEEKTQIHIGRAVVDYDLCVVNRDGVRCGNCARHCPAGAIMMVRKDPSDPSSRMIPSVVEDRCIGCGACENLCPSRPISAIHVNGLKTHITS